MDSQNHSTLRAAAGLLALLMGSGAATAVAQAPTPSPGKAPQHHEAMQGMNGRMAGAHHVLAMAYRDNLVTFAKALQGQVTHSKTVDLDLARPAVAEMRRSFEQLQQHHQAHMQMMTMMGDSAKAPMAGAMQHMDTHLSALGEHLTALEAEVNGSAPDPKKVSDHTAEILKQCAGMSAMPSKAKPHTME